MYLCVPQRSSSASHCVAIYAYRHCSTTEMHADTALLLRDACINNKFVRVITDTIRSTGEP
jgi:hypothetical protein